MSDNKDIEQSEISLEEDHQIYKFPFFEIDKLFISFENYKPESLFDTFDKIILEEEQIRLENSRDEVDKLNQLK